MYMTTLLLEHRRDRSLYLYHQVEEAFRAHVLYYIYITTLLHVHEYFTTHTFYYQEEAFRARMSQSLDEAQERYEKIVKDRDLKVSLLHPPHH